MHIINRNEHNKTLTDVSIDESAHELCKLDRPRANGMGVDATL